MSKSKYMEWMQESFLYEADDDDNYVHVGGGRYKEVNKRTGEALPNSPSYIKKDSGGYEMVDDDDPRLSKDDDKEKKTPVSIDIDAAGGLGTPTLQRHQSHAGSSPERQCRTSKSSHPCRCTQTKLGPRFAAEPRAQGTVDGNRSSQIRGRGQRLCPDSDNARCSARDSDGSSRHIQSTGRVAGLMR